MSEDADNTAWVDEAAALASVVTRQRSEIDTLRAALEETGLKASYTARDGTLHPGATSTVADVWRFLWGEGKAE